MKPWGPTEYIMLVMLILGGTWIAAKLLGVLWRLVRPPVMATVDRYLIVNSDDDEDAEIPVVANVAAPAATPVAGVAMPQNASNALLLQAKAEALAAMVKAGKVGETEGIKIVFGLTASSTNPKYAEARDALKAAQAKLNGPVVLDPTGKQVPLSYPVSGRKVPS